MIKKKYFWLIVILLIAAFFRFYLISSYPAGLFPDEAANGLDAERILGGDHRLFFKRGNGRGALYFYLLAGLFKFFGAGVWQIHLTSALIGFLAIISFYFLSREWFNRQIAIIASLLASISLPATIMSRVGFRGVLLTLIFPWFFLFLSKAIKKRGLLYPALAGACLGLSLYAYIAARVMVPIFGLLAISLLWANWRKISALIGGGFLTFGPLLVYFIQNPDSLVKRAGHVSIFNPDLNQGKPLLAFLINIKKTVLMFFTQGDLNWRHNISGSPFFNPLIAGLFLAGLIWLIYYFYQQAFQKRKNIYIPLSIFAWFIAGLLPMLLTAEGIPHFLRAQSIIPVVFIFPALALYKIWHCPKFNKKIISSFLVILLVVSLGLNYYNYFIKARRNSANHYAFRADLTKVAEQINQRQNKSKTFLVLEEYSLQTINFLTYRQGQQFIWLKPWLINQRDYPPQSLVIFTKSTISEFKKFKQPTDKILITHLQ